MNRILILLSVLALGFAATLPARAQSQPVMVVERISIKVKPGEAQQWEAAFKRFHAWEHQHNYPFSSSTFLVVVGKGTGQYFVARFGPNWSDFDKIDKFDSSIGVDKEIQETVAPYTESIDRTFSLLNPDLSVLALGEHPPSPLIRIVSYSLKPGSLPAIIDVIRQMNVAIKKTNWPGRRIVWLERAEGDGAQLFRFAGFQDWADFQSPKPSLRAELVKVYGKARAAALLHDFNERLLSVSSQVLRYRPDLSYTPTP